MSANKGFDTTVSVDSEMESGYLSAPISGILSVENVDISDVADKKSDNDKKVISDSSEQEQLDSGVDLQVSEQLSSLSFKDFTPTAEPLLEDLGEDKSNVIAQLDRLFKQDDDGDTQLHIASVHGCQKSVSTLIKVCPQRAWMDVSNDYGHTALHLAVLSGHRVVIRTLLLAGASLDVRDVAGRTPLHLAVDCGDMETIKTLLMPSPNLTKETRTRVVNMKDYRGQACVHYAARAGRFDIILVLEKLGADILLGEGLAGWTALHMAARAGDETLVRALLRKYPLAARARDFAGRSPRRLAARAAAAAFPRADPAASDTDDSEYDSEDEERESLFEKLVQRSNPINVA